MSMCMRMWPVVALAALLACMPASSFGQAAPPASTTYVEVDGARLFVRSVGAGTPIVVVHGGPGLSHDYIAPQLIALLADEDRLIFYDQRASGRSSGVEDTYATEPPQAVRPQR